MNAPFDPAAERYVSLATFRRDGREVRTPIWIAGAGGKLYAFSAGAAGKVKRIRNNGRARLAPCGLRGTLLADTWLDASAREVDDPAIVASAYRALRAKYGWQMWLADAGARLTGRYAKRAVLELVPAGATDAPSD